MLAASLVDRASDGEVLNLPTKRESRGKGKKITELKATLPHAMNEMATKRIPANTLFPAASPIVKPAPQLANPVTITAIGVKINSVKQPIAFFAVSGLGLSTMGVCDDS